MAITDIMDEIGGPQLAEMTLEQPPPGHALQISNDDLTKLSAIHFAPITARRVEVKRDQAEVLRRIREAATLGADDFYYSFPVRTKGGGRDYIEGISIDGAMASMQAYGNCEVDCRPVDIGHSWIFLARFIDHERGTSLIRPFIQRKVGGSRLGGDDEGRRLEIASSIGASKATRNVIANAIRPFTNYCFERAKSDLVKRVGANLETNRQAVLRSLDKLGVSLKRVEALNGRVAAEWTAREVAGLVVQIKSVQQGLATPNDIWPAEPPPEPRRSDVESDTVQPASAAVPDRPVAETGPVAATHTASSPPASEPPADIKETPPATADLSAGGPAAGPENIPSDSQGQSPDLSMRLEHWRVGDDVVGQENIITRLVKLVGLVETAADLDAIESQNAERLARITGIRRSNLNNLIRSKRESLR
jgi:hypothetical protein